MHIYRAQFCVVSKWCQYDFICLQLKPSHSLSNELPTPAFNVDNKMFPLEAEVLLWEGKEYY